MHGATAYRGLLDGNVERAGRRLEERINCLAVLLLRPVGEHEREMEQVLRPLHGKPRRRDFEAEDEAVLREAIEKSIRVDCRARAFFQIALTKAIRQAE